MRRGGPWFIPTLLGEPRLAKPPLTTWVTASAARPETVDALRTRDPAARNAAFRRLAWQIRWPALLAACLMLAANCVLGSLLFDAQTGLVAALACGSSLMFLRFCRAATTDVQLAFWVTTANALLALAIFRGRTWAGFVGAGAALGLAFMSKGPVALAQTVVPFACFAAWRRLAPAAPRPAPARPATLPLLCGTAVMLAVALPWPLAVLLKYPDIASDWYKEIFREGATQLAPDPWYTYLVLLPWMLPWLSFFLAGAYLGFVSLWRTIDLHFDRGDASGTRHAGRQGFVLALLLTLVPILVMSCFKDKNERYLLPMAPPAAILAGAALVNWFRSDRRDPAGRLVEAAHWVTVAVICVGPLVLGLFAKQFRLGDQPWSRTRAVAVAAAATIAFLVALRVRLRGVALAAFTAALMLALQYPFMAAYVRISRSDLKPLADIVWEKYPDARVYEFEPGTRRRMYYDLPIYAGRITTKVYDLATLKPGPQPQVVVFYDTRGEAPPPPAPWHEIGSGGGRKRGWRAYVLTGP